MHSRVARILASACLMVGTACAADDAGPATPKTVLSAGQPTDSPRSRPTDLAGRFDQATIEEWATKWAKANGGGGYDQLEWVYGTRGDAIAKTGHGQIGAEFSDTPVVAIQIHGSFARNSGLVKASSARQEYLLAIVATSTGEVTDFALGTRSDLSALGEVQRPHA